MRKTKNKVRLSFIIDPNHNIDNALNAVIETIAYYQEERPDKIELPENGNFGLYSGGSCYGVHTIENLD